MLEYKGYTGSVDYSDEDAVLHGRLQFIRDLVTYEGTNAETLEQAFQEAVDDYLSLVDPALMSTTKSDDTDDQGEIIGDLHRITDTLPPPDQLVPHDDTVKVTLALSRRSVDFLKREAAKQSVPYQRLIRALVDEYTRRIG